jgi:transcriptional regulator with XRE-family HTH domain
MPLDQLRKAQQMTQLRLAGVLGINQGEVSKIEHRSDLRGSTLADYVEAIGGRLEIRAVFKPARGRECFSPAKTFGSDGLASALNNFGRGWML